jgi:hypothetical protein
MMKPDMFKTPVRILTGLGIPTSVNSVGYAYRLLVDWPISGRDNAHSVALRACHAALNGEIDAETVRGLFVAFAERQDLLVPDAEPLVAIRGKQSSEPHVR